MLSKFVVRFTDPSDFRNCEESGITQGETFVETVKKIINYYGENETYFLSVEPLIQDDYDNDICVINRKDLPDRVDDQTDIANFIGT